MHHLYECISCFEELKKKGHNIWSAEPREIRSIDCY